MIVCSVVWLLAGCAAVPRQVLFYPTHHDRANELGPWRDRGRLIGFSREVARPEHLWLLLHGNGGQAADRTYALPRFSPRDSVFILEYPGYGRRPGTPSRAAIDAAAIEAYRLLCARFPGRAIGVVGESLGSGPACVLAGEAEPPVKIVLLVPFDSMKRVAAGPAPWLPSGVPAADRWDNVGALAGYRGVVEIHGARDDTVIPCGHARRLAERLPAARFEVFPGGHNEWSQQQRIAIRQP